MALRDLRARHRQRAVLPALRPARRARRRAARRLQAKIARLRAFERRAAARAIRSSSSTSACGAAFPAPGTTRWWRRSSAKCRSISRALQRATWRATRPGADRHDGARIPAVLPDLRRAPARLPEAALEDWVQEYRGDLGIALTDVVGMDAFLADFDLYFAKLFDGLRHDSGDPVVWGEKALAHYAGCASTPTPSGWCFPTASTSSSAIALYRHFADRTQMRLRHRHQPDQRHGPEDPES